MLKKGGGYAALRFLTDDRLSAYDVSASAISSSFLSALGPAQVTALAPLASVLICPHLAPVRPLTLQPACNTALSPSDAPSSYAPPIHPPLYCPTHPEQISGPVKA